MYGTCSFIIFQSVARGRIIGEGHTFRGSHSIRINMVLKVLSRAGSWVPGALELIVEQKFFGRAPGPLKY